MATRKDLIFFADTGVCGTFCDFVSGNVEQDFVNIKYYPLNSFRAVTYGKKIHKDNIHHLASTSGEKGVEKRIVFVYTGETGSLVKNILDVNNLTLIKELRETIRKLKMQIGTYKQETEDARSGVSKTMASIDKIKGKREQPSGFGSRFGSEDRYGFDSL